MLKKIKGFSLGLGLVGVALMTPNLVGAKATGPCVDCHTMHNSQNGADLYASPSGALTNDGCVGCHTGTNVALGNIPYVLGDVAPTYGTNTLAGGNFWWVTADDTTAHNVEGIKAADASNTGSATPQTPPGWNPDFDADTEVNNGAATWTDQLTCAGTNGCHGQHEITGAPVDDFTSISGSHHGDDSDIDGSTTIKSFRFLYGIIGKEDTDWEFATAADNHNQYYGYDRSNDTPPVAASEGAKSINYLCAECHGKFHSGAADDDGCDTLNTAASAWLRHPTDYDMNDLTGEYLLYNTDGTYEPLVPVATDRSTAGVVVVTVSDVYGANGDAIVSCVSCHRAHGSPNADLLRWDYGDCEAGTADAGCGCFICHSTKDDA